MKYSQLCFAAMFLVVGIAGCKKSESETAKSAESIDAEESGTHTHPDGTTHADHDDEVEHSGSSHGHDEVDMGTVTIGDMEIELAQGHGKVEAGKECHLVVKLPYSDNGATTVRAWIGTEDRTLSRVGKGEYAASHDDYDVHATAPAPLPDNVMWWIEIEKPDSTRLVGSAKPLLD